MSETNMSVKSSPIVVVAIILVILISISLLLPFLSHGDPPPRAMWCMRNLKQYGDAIQMYAADHKGMLPGPVNMLIHEETSKFWGSSAPPGCQEWYQQQLPYLLAKYMGAKGKQNIVDIVDRVAVCPTAPSLKRADGQGLPLLYQPQASYIINTGADAGIVKNDYANGWPKVPLYITAPESYFGWVRYKDGIQAHINDAIAPLYKLPINQRDYRSAGGRLPSKIDRVRKPSHEWAVADLWAAQVGGKGESVRPVGTWPFDLNSTDPVFSSPVVNQGKMRVPSYPYHYTTKTYSTAIPNDMKPDDSRLSDGSTSALYFDGHAQRVRPWKGVGNPRHCTDKDQLPIGDEPDILPTTTTMPSECRSE